MPELKRSLKSDFIKSQNWLVLVILLFPIIVSFFRLRTLDNDFYFLYATGDYIVKNGFPHYDMLSMHSDMKIVVQQWLSSVIFYFVYSKFGMVGMLVLLYSFYIGICLLSYRLNYLITNNKLLSALIACITDFLLFKNLAVTRPQLFTYTFLLIELCLLEKFVLTKKNLYLAVLPLLSLALVNLHAAMWPMMFVFMLPYIVAAIPVNITIKGRRFKYEPCCNLLPLLCSFAVSIVLGLLNPYGIDNVIYLTSSYGQDKLNAMIIEMQPTSLSIQYGKYFFLFLALIGVIVFFKKKSDFSVRFFCLFCGTTLLALMHVKAISYFFVFSISAFSYVLRDIEFKLPEKIKITRTVNLLTGIIAVLILAVTCLVCLNDSILSKPSFEYHYEQLDEIVEILDREEAPVVLYTNFNDGQYLEYKGYHPYIDGRAELFLLANNDSFDYFEEYYNMKSAHMYYKDFTDKYGFNYLIISKESDRYLYMSLLYDDDYEITYESSGLCLFELK